MIGHHRPLGIAWGGEVQGYSRETDCWVPAQDEGARRFEYLQSQPLFALVLVCRSGTTRDLVCLVEAQLGSESGDGVSMLLQRESGIAWYRCGRFEASKHQSHHGPPSALINLCYVATYWLNLLAAIQIQLLCIHAWLNANSSRSLLPLFILPVRLHPWRSPGAFFSSPTIPP